MRCLVTGGGGFVGGWLCEHLRSHGDDVISTDHEVDVTDARQIEKAVLDADPSVIYHLAARAHVGSSWSEPAEALRVNAIGTLNVLEAARACDPPPSVLLVSSAEVYGIPRKLPVTEADPLVPVTPYAASKVAAEFLGVQAHAAHGLRVIRVRPFNHVGPRQSPAYAVSALAKRVVEAELSGSRQIPVGNLAARRDLTDVRDVVAAYRMLGEGGEPGEVYNVCSGRDVAIGDLAAQLIELAGFDLELVPDPALMRPVDVPVIRGDYRRLHEAVGWEPRIDLAQTLADVLDYWRNELRRGS